MSPSFAALQAYTGLLRLQAGLPCSDRRKRRSYRKARRRSPALLSLADFILTAASKSDLERLARGAGLYRCDPSCLCEHLSGVLSGRCAGWHVLSAKEARSLGGRAPILVDGEPVRALAKFALSLREEDRGQIAFDDQQAALNALKSLAAGRNPEGFQIWLERMIEFTQLNEADL